MTATIEISLYPLHNEYPSSVLNFLQKLKAIPGLDIQSNGMSTIVIGQFEKLWPELGDLLTSQLSMEDSICVLKVAQGRREYVD
ncbi:MAG: hypothetical protein WBB31_10815 [Saprospiraceae bacterium]